MRRMYSEQELTRIIGEVFDQKLESGALDSSISDAVDAYLVEHPVDITALEGQTIAPAVVNATTSISAPSINGESNPSVKPIYYHPIYLNINTTAEPITNQGGIQIVVMDNTSSAYVTVTAIAKVKALMDVGAIITCNGTFKKSGSSTVCTTMFMQKVGSEYRFYFHDLSTVEYISIDSADYSFTVIADGVNKIN